MGWGPVDWVGIVLPEAKLKRNVPCFLNFLDLSDQFRDICKIRSDDSQTNKWTDKWTDFPLIDSTPERGRVKSDFNGKKRDWTQISINVHLSK